MEKPDDFQAKRVIPEPVILGPCTLYHADCVDVLPHLTGVDAVVTDPPYGVNLGSHHAAKDLRRSHLHKDGYASYKDTPENFRSIIAPVLRRLVKDVGQCIIFTAVQNIRLLPPPSAIGGAYIPMGSGRNAFGFTNLAPALMYGKCPTNHLGCKNTMMVLNQQNEPENGHPCPKPLKLIVRMLLLGSEDGQTVLDPFLGRIMRDYAHIMAREVERKITARIVHPTPRIRE